MGTVHYLLVFETAEAANSNYSKNSEKLLRKHRDVVFFKKVLFLQTYGRLMSKSPEPTKFWFCEISK